MGTLSAYGYTLPTNRRLYVLCSGTCQRRHLWPVVAGVRAAVAGSTVFGARVPEAAVAAAGYRVGSSSPAGAVAYAREHGHMVLEVCLA